MSYSQGGLIDANDYNNYVGNDPTTGSGTLNAVWGVGSGNAGYGLTTIPKAATSAGLVTAGQWATFFSRLNTMYGHQLNTGSGISSTVNTGDLITFQSSLNTAIANIYTNRLSCYARGSVATVGSNPYTFNWSAGSTASAESSSFSRTVSFASGDAARYFFNQGGRIRFVTVSATNNNSQGRSADLVDLINNKIGTISNFAYGSNAGRSGSGGQGVTNNTGLGYYSLSSGAQTLVQVTSTGYPYSGDYISISVNSNGTNVSGHGDCGSTITFNVTTYLGGLQSDFGNKAVNISWNHRIDIEYPENTYLSGTPSYGSISVS